MKPESMHIHSFEELEAYLRTFQNWQGPGEEYDFGGAVHLLLTCLNSLQTHALDSELEDIGMHMTPEQRNFLLRLAHQVKNNPEGEG